MKSTVAHRHDTVTMKCGTVTVARLGGTRTYMRTVTHRNDVPQIRTRAGVRARAHAHAHARVINRRTMSTVVTVCDGALRLLRSRQATIPFDPPTLVMSIRGCRGMDDGHHHGVDAHVKPIHVAVQTSEPQREGMRVQGSNAAGGSAVRERVSKRGTLGVSIRVGRGSMLAYLLRVGRYCVEYVYSHDRQYRIVRSKPYSPTPNTRVSVRDRGYDRTPIGRAVCALWPTPRSYLLDTHRYQGRYLRLVGQRGALGTN